MHNKTKYTYTYIIFIAVISIIITAMPVCAGTELTIPETYGTTKDTYTDNYSDSVIVHIQDLHCNYDAQMSIYNIINKLVNEHNFTLVTIEGPVGRLDTAPFSNYSDEEIKMRVAQHFLKVGSINGAGFAHIMSKGGFSFWGVDDPVLYRQGTEAFMGAVGIRPENNAFCDNIKSILNELKQKAYNKKLLNFDSQLNAYKQDKIAFAEFSNYLNELINEYKVEKENYTNFNKLIEVLTLEKQIDFTSVDTQRSECIEYLSKKLKDEELSKLLDMSLHFKTQKIGAVEFYSYLKDTVGKNSKKVDFKKYPELEKYISYILSYNNIEHTGLFDEIEKIQDELKEKLFIRQAERDIDILSKNIDILKNLINLKLTTKALDYYRKDRSAFLAQTFVNFINENAPKYKIRYQIHPAFRKIDAQLPDLEKFYTAALQRDKALVENTINRMSQLNTKKAILIAGGFHTEGITDSLKKKGISYVVVTPKVNEIDEKNTLYMSVMMGEKTMLEKAFYDEIKDKTKENADALAFQQAARYYADVIYKTILDIEKEKK